MKRRTLVGSALAMAGAAVLPAPSIAQTSRVTTAGVTLNHSYCVFDTLYGTDEKFQVHPQMAEGHEVSGDGLTWTIRLRPGLKFHDGRPVRAADCVASLQR